MSRRATARRSGWGNLRDEIEAEFRALEGVPTLFGLHLVRGARGDAKLSRLRYQKSEKGRETVRAFKARPEQRAAHAARERARRARRKAER